MKYLVVFFVLISVMSASCTFHAPEFRGDESFRIEKIDGEVIRFSGGGKVYNGNWFGVKVKPSELEVYLDGQYMGKIYLEKKVKMKAKRETQLEAPFRAELEKGAMLKALGMASKETVSLRLKGKVKGGVFIFSKKIEIDETKSVSPAALRNRSGS